MRLFRERLAVIRRAVEAAEWRGRAGATDLLVIREFIAIPELRGTLVFGMNLRSIAERIGVSVSTVHGAVKRFKGKGFLKVARADRPAGDSTTWRLCCPPKWSKTEQRSNKVAAGARPGVACDGDVQIRTVCE